jgi:hypothetical protein
LFGAILPVEDPHTLPLLNGISLWVVGVSVIGATGLHAWRNHNGGHTGRGQFFNDGGALISLFVLGSMLIDMVHPMRQIGGLVRDNAILVFWAIGYAGVMVVLNLLDSARNSG